MITRRGLFSLFPALGVVAIPPLASSDSTPAVEPIILEHTCDCGKAFYTPAEIADKEAYYRESVGSPPYWGCGTTFQWHFGVQPFCPKCGICYDASLPMIKRGVYRVVKGRFPE